MGPLHVYGDTTRQNYPPCSSRNDGTMNIWKGRLVKSELATTDRMKVAHAAVFSAEEAVCLKSMTVRSLDFGCSRIALWPNKLSQNEDLVDEALESAGRTDVVTTSHTDENEEDFASYLCFGIDPGADEIEIYFLSFSERRLKALFNFLPDLQALTRLRSVDSRQTEMAR